MKKLGILVITAMVTMIAACDDATKEKIKEADKSATSLVESAQSQWDETRKQATDLADQKMAELNAAQPLDEAKKKISELGEMKLSDLISGGDDEQGKEAEEAESESN
ncbi:MULTISPECIES: hypothetical protein [Erwinia]|uniref:hypothetical protein n=1 Tax=Erwinia TaxID=551 RepID=UPI00105CA637|nr:hypothetical protein [Erwinia aphidicola]MCP2231566.1 uncharacterized lipoprotein YehR (DUF1307 family) [Erwinia aphidicola]